MRKMYSEEQIKAIIREVGGAGENEVVTVEAGVEAVEGVGYVSIEVEYEDTVKSADIATSKIFITDTATGYTMWLDSTTWPYVYVTDTEAEGGIAKCQIDSFMNYNGRINLAFALPGEATYVEDGDSCNVYFRLIPTDKNWNIEL